MPTAAQRDRFAAVAGSLVRLAAVQRGELIRAEDWNALVNGLIELARTLLEADEAGGVPPHEHAEQVAMAWLRPELRTLLEKGPLQDPVAVERVLRLERQLALLQARLNDMDDGVRGVRTRLAEVITRDLARESDLTAVRHKVEGVADSRDDVLTLRRSLDTLGVQVQSANDAAARLTVGGQPADLEALHGRLGQLEQVRDALRQPDGQLVSAAGLESRFAQFANTLVTENELSTALSTHVAELDAGQIAALKGGLQTTLQEEVAEKVDRLGKDLDVSLASRLGDVDAAASRAVAGALPGLQKSALEAANASVETALAKSTAASAALLDKRLAESEAARDKQLESRLADVQGGLLAAVTSEVGRQVPSQLTGLDGKFEQLSKALALQTQRLEAADASIKATQVLFTDFQASATRDLAAARTELLGEMSSRDAAQATQFSQQLKAQDSAQQASTKAAIEASSTEMFTQFSKFNPAAAGSTFGSGLATGVTKPVGGFGDFTGRVTP